MRPNNVICVENTTFMPFGRNFAGDPRKDKFRSTTRKAILIIPDEGMALDMIERGINVKTTNPRPGEEENFVPTYFVSIVANYDSSRPPRIHLVSGDGEPVLLDEESIGNLDDCDVQNVRVVLNPWTNKNTGRTTLYIQTMYVEQAVDYDPYAHHYMNVDEEAPF